jgi:hypothetical protein
MSALFALAITTWGQPPAGEGLPGRGRHRRHQAICHLERRAGTRLRVRSRSRKDLLLACAIAAPTQRRSLDFARDDRVDLWGVCTGLLRDTRPKRLVPAAPSFVT